MGDLLTWPLRIAIPTRPGAFRLFLALLVFVYHFSSFGMGHYAVHVFFILSGYWLYRMWMERYRETRSPYATFLISRVWRLAPVMLLVSAVTIPLLLAMGKPVDQVLAANPAHLAFSSIAMLGYAWLPYAPVGAAWSLDIEMQFYLAVPVLAALVARGRPLAVLVAALLSSVGCALVGGAPILPTYLLFFVIGMVAAKVDWRPGRKLAGGSAALVFAALVLVTLSPWKGVLWGGNDPGPLYVWNVPFNALLAIGSAPYAIHTVHRRSDATDRMLGDLSYIVYLLHWVAMQWFFTLEGSFLQRLPAAAACFVVVPGAALAIWYWVDRPANRARAAYVASRLSGPQVHQADAAGTTRGVGAG